MKNAMMKDKDEEWVTVGIYSDPGKSNYSKGNRVEGEWINVGDIMKVKSALHGNGYLS